ncbi:MAG: sigma-70 family RNA polymerase sigma factor [Victivallales bacterium]|nr:sigma-70 family RNA polymerase sigma factor [Victivallales bacterium]
MVRSDVQNPIPDNELVKRFQESGDLHAFNTLVERHNGRAYQIAYGILANREDCEEVVQDAFVRIFRALPNFRGDSEFTTWMYRIVVNLCNNKYRWNKSRRIGRNISLDAPLEHYEGSELRLELPSPMQTPDKLVELAELRSKTAKAMQALPESYRNAVLLRNVRHLDYDQIAAILGCPVGTVKSRINRGREMLRQMLEL